MASKSTAILLAILFSGGCHAAGCGDDYGTQYAHYIDPSAYCIQLCRGGALDPSWEDAAICTIKSGSGTEDWYCDGTPRCRPLGAPIQMRRVQ